jgi:hypothetical protein
VTLPSPQDVTINPDPASAVGVTIHKHEEKLKAIRGSPNWTSSACPPSRLFAPTTPTSTTAPAAPAAPPASAPPPTPARLSRAAYCANAHAI